MPSRMLESKCGEERHDGTSLPRSIRSETVGLVRHGCIPVCMMHASYCELEIVPGTLDTHPHHCLKHGACGGRPHR